MAKTETPKKISEKMKQRLLGEAVETILCNIGADATKSEVAKAKWLIAEIEDCTRFPEFAPLKGKLLPWFEEWRKGKQPRLEL